MWSVAYVSDTEVGKHVVPGVQLGDTVGGGSRLSGDV